MCRSRCWYGVISHGTGEQFCVPAITCIVSHLVAEMLPEAEVLVLDTDAQQILSAAREEVAQGLIGHQTLRASE